jgi:hypothetical protein
MKAKSTLIAGIVSLALLLPGVSLAQCSLSFTYTVTESRCKSTGAIHVEVTGGSGSYNYKLSGGSIPSINTSSKDITGLPAGTYRLE